MSHLRLIGPLDPNFAWDGYTLYDQSDFRVELDPPYGLRGAAASVQSGADGTWRILRDPLGINKLFWARDGARNGDGDVAVAARPRRLVDEGWPFEHVRAVPYGCVLDLRPDAPAPVWRSLVPDAWFSADRAGEDGIEAIGRRIRVVLDRYLAALAAAYPAAQVFVCLSGGLDSSGIAALARRHFTDAVAVSFDLTRPGGRTSEDRRTAEFLARDLDLPLLDVTVTEEELLGKLDTVLVEGIDWRDFNVHAGLVNAALADAVRRAARHHGGDGSTIVLTGDLVNEFLVDYHPETYRGGTYYGLPRLSHGALRTSLVRGLDTSHREVGVFGAWGLPVVQPYAAAVDEYLALSGRLLALQNRKQQLCRAVFGRLIPEYVYARPKARAQVGDSDTGDGVLATCVDRGLDSVWLRQRFSELHGVTDPGALDRFMRAGRYRSAAPPVAGAAR